ncbi:MAG TPA: helix-turn-helix transcriptional regulator [Gemmataceae bacterium]|nr:helix-turn-helix transcriptional regulator [Gemmataceae bacterium]
MDAKWFAGRLGELRKNAGMTQQQLADKAGLKLGGVRDLEQGRSGPTWDTVLALCKALGVDCTAFTIEPATDDKPGRGRPPKSDPAPEVKPAKGASRKRTKKKS